MKLTGNEDLRVQKTIDAIYKSFYKLICETEYNKITVKELCNTAKINKKTFYRYYPTLDDLSIELRNILTDEFIERIEKFDTVRDTDKMIAEFYYFAEEVGKPFEKIICSSKYADTRKWMFETVVKKLLQQTEYAKHYSECEQNILLSYIDGSVMEIYKQWIADGKQIPIDNIIDLTIKLIINGLSIFHKM